MLLESEGLRASCGGLLENDVFEMHQTNPWASLMKTSRHVNYHAGHDPLLPSDTFLTQTFTAAQSMHYVFLSNLKKDLLLLLFESIMRPLVTS